MKNIVSYLLFALLFVPVWAGAQVRGEAPEEQGFVRQTQDGAVTVYVRPEGNGDLSIRVTATSSAPVPVIVGVLDDVAAYPAWIHRCDRAYVLPGAKKNAFVYYSLIDLPFPFADREVVAAVEQTTDPATGVFTRTISSRPSALPPPQKARRVETYEAVWQALPTPQGGSRISCTVRTGAGSNLPGWLRREIMTGGPAKTVNNLLRRAEGREKE